jgi:hypothetical protein
MPHSFLAFVLSTLLISAPDFNQSDSAAADRTYIVSPFRVEGIPSVDDLGSSNNTVIWMHAGAGASIYLIGWNIDLEAFGDSWRSDIAVLITNSSRQGAFRFTPGYLDQSPADPTNDNSGG